MNRIARRTATAVVAAATVAATVAMVPVTAGADELRTVVVDGVVYTIVNHGTWPVSGSVAAGEPRELVAAAPGCEPRVAWAAAHLVEYEVLYDPAMRTISYRWFGAGSAATGYCARRVFATVQVEDRPVVGAGTPASGAPVVADAVADTRGYGRATVPDHGAAATMAVYYTNLDVAARAQVLGSVVVQTSGSQVDADGHTRHFACESHVLYFRPTQFGPHFVDDDKRACPAPSSAVGTRS